MLSISAILSCTLTHGNEAIKMSCGHVMFKIGGDRYALNVPNMKEVIQIVRNGDGFVITRQKVGGSNDVLMSKQDGWIFVESLDRFREDDYTFCDMSKVEQIINRYLYEVN